MILLIMRAYRERAYKGFFVSVFNKTHIHGGWDWHSWFMVLIGILLLVGCGGGDKLESGDGGPDVPPTPVILKVKVTGMTDPGLVLQNESNGEELAIDKDGVFNFGMPLYPKDTYNISVIAAPAALTCTVNNGSGVIVVGAIAPVTNVYCNTQSYAVGGEITGLWPGNKVTLLNNGTDLSVFTGRANKGPVTYSFEALLAMGSTYTVTVAANPSNQVCTAMTAGGYTGISLNNSDVTNVNFKCGPAANGRTIGGWVTGLKAGNQIVLQNNGSDNQTISANRPFFFDIKVANQTSYDVRVLTASADQVCMVENGVGEGPAVQGDVRNVNVICNMEGVTIGGTVSGLKANLKAGNSVELLLGDNKQESLTVDANTPNGAFTFKTLIPVGAAYSVNVGSQPLGQICTPTNNTGKATAPVKDVRITCSDQSFTVSGKVTGWNGSEMILKNRKTNSYATVRSDGTFTFSAMAYDTPYEIIVERFPVIQDCTVTGGTGIVKDNVNSVVVDCKAAAVTVLGSLNINENAGYPVGLIQGQDGDLYGITTSRVESYREDRHYRTGSIFKMPTVPTGPMTTLYTFLGSNPNRVITYDPSFPTGLMQGSDSVIYITTYLGGPGSDQDLGQFRAPSTKVGEIYKLIPAPIPTVSSLYSFQCGANPILEPCTVNVAPIAELIEGPDGDFYGVAYGYAYRGFKAHGGMVYRLTASGEFTLLHDFTFAGVTDGLRLNGKLTFADGFLYGTTEKGGRFGRGTIFRVDLTGSDFDVVYHFPPATFPEHPGIGVPSLTYPDGIYSDPYRNPYSGLTLGSDGNLYGIAKYGGDNGAGWIFKVALTDTIRVKQLYSFAKNTNPSTELTQLSDGNFYGTIEGNYDPVTRTGGMGSIFKFTPQGNKGTLTTLHNFGGITANGDGNTPSTRLVVGKDGNLYGATRYGGYFNEGTVYKIGKN